MDARVFASDLADPTFQTNPKWQLSYSARETYGPLGGLKPGEPLSPAFWHKVTEAFAANDTAFQLYNKFSARGGVVMPCTGDCKTKTICNLRALRAENNCDDSTPGLQFKKREEPTNRMSHRSNECEPMGLQHIMSRLPGSISKVDRKLLIARLEEAIAGG